MNRSDESHRSSLLRTVLLYFAAWLVTWVGLLLLYAEFRDSASVSVLGRPYTGREALLILVVYATLPISLLAVAMKKFFDYRRSTKP